MKRKPLAPIIGNSFKASAEVLAASSCLAEIESMRTAGASWRDVVDHFESLGYKVAPQTLQVAARRQWLAAGMLPPKKGRAKTNPFTPAAYGSALAPAFAAARASGWTVNQMLEDLGLGGWSMSKRTLETALRASASGRAEPKLPPVPASPCRNDAVKNRPAFFKPKLLVRLLSQLIEELAGPARDWDHASAVLAKSGFLIGASTLKRYASLAKEQTARIDFDEGVRDGE